MAEYGKIHTDGSRSGGQPVLLPCGHCGEQCADLIIDQGDKWAHYSASCLEVRTGYNLSDDAPWRAEAIAAYNKRQPTQSDAVRDLVATLWCASGCSCCRDDDAWEKASHELAELLGIPKYDDGSGYDWYSVCDAAKGQSK